MAGSRAGVSKVTGSDGRVTGRGYPGHGLGWRGHGLGWQGRLGLAARMARRVERKRMEEAWEGRKQEQPGSWAV
eukprot:934029-Rhodomonas_salina.2